MKYEEITRQIIRCAMNVHGVLGNGYQEVIYQRAMQMEFKIYNLTAIPEMIMPIHYRDKQIGTRKVDFFVEDLILVELKAVITLENAHLTQALNYLEGSKKEIGLLINFGSPSLEFKRIHNNKLIPQGTK